MGCEDAESGQGPGCLAADRPDGAAEYLGDVAFGQVLEEAQNQDGSLTWAELGQSFAYVQAAVHMDGWITDPPVGGEFDRMLPESSPAGAIGSPGRGRASA